MRMRSPNNIIEDSNISRIASSNSRALPSFSQMLARSKNNTNNYLNDNNDSNNSSVNQEFEFQMDNDSSSDYRDGIQLFRDVNLLRRIIEMKFKS